MSGTREMKLPREGVSSSNPFHQLMLTSQALYYSAATLSGAFSGLIAYGILKNLTLESTGRDPWRWLFIVEGSMAMGVGVLTWIFLPRFPDQMKIGKHWLFNKEEIALAAQRSSSKSFYPVLPKT